MVLIATLIIFGGAAATYATGTVYDVENILDYYSGVLALVALSISVMIGLAATDQLILTPRQRLVAQTIHRVTAFTSVAMLMVHIVGKIIRESSDVIDVFVPGLANYNRLAIGLGTVAAYLMILVTASGIFRTRFAGTIRPWIWRTLHATAYAAWPPAIIHGLMAGRPPANWVTASYVFCVLAVALALPTRLITRARTGRQK